MPRWPRSTPPLGSRSASATSGIDSSRGLGGFPDRTPLNARVTGTLERDDYRVEKLVYESLPGFYVTANVYVPRGHAPPYPAVLGVAGHTANGKASATYQHAWISMAKRGFLVLAFDPPGQGERSLYFDPDLGRSRVGIGTREHTLSGLQCLLTGHNFARYEIWDAIRGVDYLLTRGDVDPDRLAVAGNSGGGTQAAYLAVVEPRLAVAVSSCYMTSWKQLWFEPGPQDAEQDLSAFLHHGLDFADYATAFAPRPFQILSAIQDFFPIAGARAAYAETRRVYETLGAADRAGFFEYDDTHGWSKPRREATYRWLERWLHDRVDDGHEPDHVTELESDLYATPTGQVSTAYDDAETVQTLNRAVAEEMFPNRTATRLESPGELATLVRSRLEMAGPLRSAHRGAPRHARPRRLPHREDRPGNRSGDHRPRPRLRPGGRSGPQAGGALRGRRGQGSPGRGGRRHRGPGPLGPRRSGSGCPGYRRESADVRLRRLSPGVADAPASAPRGPDHRRPAG